MLNYKRGQPFGRVIALLNLMASINHLPIEDQAAAHAALPTYKSGGKGGKIPHKTGHKAMAYVRAKRKIRNRRKHEGR